jgi:hypothetical protein
VPGWRDDLTIRDEANAITAYAFRNGFLEDLHAGEHSELVESNRYGRITDDEMKKLMIEASSKVAELLQMARDDPDGYRDYIRRYYWMYCRKWER